MNANSIVVTLLSSAGGVAIGLELTKALIGWVHNRRPREQAENDRLRRERDEADMQRRIAMEHAYEVRQIAIKYGAPVADLPTPPSFK